LKMAQLAASQDPTAKPYTADELSAAINNALAVQVPTPTQAASGVDQNLASKSPDELVKQLVSLDKNSTDPAVQAQRTAIKQALSDKPTDQVSAAFQKYAPNAPGTAQLQAIAQQELGLTELTSRIQALDTKDPNYNTKLLNLLKQTPAGDPVADQLRKLDPTNPNFHDALQAVLKANGVDGGANSGATPGVGGANGDSNTQKADAMNALQKREEEKQEILQLISKMQRMHHETMMAIINNM
jgi:hypothetical protein